MIKNILVAAVALSLFTASCGKSRAVYARNNTVEPDIAGKGGAGSGLGDLAGLGGSTTGAGGGTLGTIGGDGSGTGTNPFDADTKGTPVAHGIAPVYFAFDSAEVAASEDKKCADIAALLVANPAYVCIVKGHCDERGSEEYNRALGERRAIAVKDILIKIRPELESRITTQSMGEEVAQQGAGDDSAWSQDRKGEFEVLDQSKK
ncbi:MAG: peptidoglycan-associated lipoprotein Pal [Verrucomicrobiota bacterium]|jgi:peptidoglycan-associated lipoprotein